MNRFTNSWDIRVPPWLREWRRANKNRPYYFKVDRSTAQMVVDVLSKEYGIESPRIAAHSPPYPWNGTYEPEYGGYIFIHAKGHIKTVFHEWYHHLDYITDGAYDSADGKGGPMSLGWQFADRMWAALTRG